MLSKRKKVDEEFRAFEEEWENNFFFVNHLLVWFATNQWRDITFLCIFRPDLGKTLFMARGQLLSLILARQHQKVADSCNKLCTHFEFTLIS